MILVWKGPALKILLLSALIGLVPTLVMEWAFDLGDAATGLSFIFLTSISTLVGDLHFRRNAGLALLSLDASTLFFIIPTWTVGGVLFLLSLVGLLGT